MGKRKTLALPIYTQICHAPSKGNIYFANSSFVLVYSTIDNTLDTIYPAHGAPYTEINNQLIYQPYYDELWSYDFDPLKQMSIFNFKDNTWTNNDREIKIRNILNTIRLYRPMTRVCIFLADMVIINIRT